MSPGSNRDDWWPRLTGLEAKGYFSGVAQHLAYDHLRHLSESFMSMSQFVPLGANSSSKAALSAYSDRSMTDFWVPVAGQTRDDS